MPSNSTGIDTDADVSGIAEYHVTIDQSTTVLPVDTAVSRCTNILPPSFPAVLVATYESVVGMQLQESRYLWSGTLMFGMSSYHLNCTRSGHIRRDSPFYRTWSRTRLLSRSSLPMENCTDLKLDMYKSGTTVVLAFLSLTKKVSLRSQLHCLVMNLQS